MNHRGDIKILWWGDEAFLTVVAGEEVVRVDQF